MPPPDRTRAAELPATLRDLEAVGALAIPTLGEIDPMLFAVADLAKRFSVRHVEPEIGVRRPRFDVVGVNLTLRPATNAGPLVAEVDGTAPHLQLRGEPRPFPVQRLPVLVRGGERTHLRLSGTTAAAKRRLPIDADERAVALRAVLPRRRVAARPAGFRAVSTRLTRPAVERDSADLAGVGDTLPTLHRPGNGVHASDVTEYADVILARSKYADVILRRAEAEGLTVEKVGNA